MNTDYDFSILDKYPEIDSYLSISNKLPIFIKLMASILLFRQKLNYTVDESESFYSYISKLDQTVFQNISKEDLPKVLKCFVLLTCSYVCNTDVADSDDDDVSECYKTKICDVIAKYMIAN